MNRKGFTLIELMIVVAIIAIIAAVAIPGLLRSRIGSHESSALASLKAVSTGQEQFKNAVAVDENTNGVGEYGFLEELGGAHACRGGGGTYTANPFIPMVLGTIVTTGTPHSSKSGYNFACFVADSGTTGVNVWADLTAADAEFAESAFVAYGWPQTQGRTGVRAFAIDTQGQPYAYPNAATSGPLTSGAQLDGTTDVPGWDDFFTSTDWSAGIDNSVWVPAG